MAMSRPEFAILGLEPHQIWSTKEFGPGLVKPTKLFDLPSNPRIASMGSCFAIEIGKWLKRNGYDYVESPHALDGSGPWGKVYNTSSMLQLLDPTWHGGEPPWVVNDRWLDPYRKWVTYPDAPSFERGRILLAQETDLVLRHSDLIVFTLGLTEVWGRAPGDVFYQVPPESVYDESRHSFWAISEYRNYLNLSSIVEVLGRDYPDLRVLFTLSPVPLRATFRDLDVYQANTISKATLRIAIEEAGVPYFPAYEMAFAHRGWPFGPDNRHVRSDVVESIMQSFANTYMGG